MVTVHQIEKGIGSFLDNELMPMIGENGLQKVIIGTGISLLLHKNIGKIVTMQQNPIVSAMGIFDQEGNIDIDSIKEEMLKQIPEEGVKVDVPMVGVLTFKKEDISKLHQYIMNA